MAVNRFAGRRSATSRWSATAARARPPWPRRCSTPPAPSTAWGGSRTAPPSATTTPRSSKRGHVAVARRRPVRVEGPQDQPHRHARLRRLRGRGRSPPCGSPTWPCSWSARSRASRCRPSACGRAAAELGLPRMVFVNKLDRERAVFDRTLDQLRGRASAPASPRWSCPSARRRRSAASPTCSPTPPSSTTDGKATARRDPRRDGGPRARGARQPGRGHRGRRRRAAGALPRRRHPRRRGARAHARRSASTTARSSRWCAARPPTERRHRPPGRLHLRDRPVARSTGRRSR